MSRLIRLVQRVGLRLHWKLLFGFIAANSVLLLALAMALFNLFGSNTALNRLKASNESFEQIQLITSTQSQLVTSALDYIWTDNLVRLNDYNVAGNDLEKALASFVPHDEQANNYTSLKKELSALQNTLDRMLEFQKTGQKQLAQELWLTQGSKQSASALLISRNLNNQEANRVFVEYIQASNNTNSAIWFISSLTVVALLVAISLAYLFTGAITNPVKLLSTRLNSLAKGDLTENLPVTSRDEFGQLALTYNSTVDSLQILVKQLNLQSRQISGAISELNTQAHYQVSGNTQQVSAISEATQTLHELSITAKEIARQAQEVLQAVDESRDKAYLVSRVADEMVVAQERGRATVAQTIDALYSLEIKVLKIEENQRELEREAAVINNVINLINNIAKETHLLALNAAIEAAGAGSYGHRFAIVAAEVKQLAIRSMNATEQVKRALVGIANSVQRGSELTIIGLEEAKKASTDAGYSDKALLSLAELSQKVKTAVYTIVEDVEKSTLLAKGIHIATQEQQVANQQMFLTMESLNSLATQNLSSVKQGENATYQLSLSAKGLQTSADTFKLVIPN
jgi:methyl-accepting chemotaxis protein